MVFNKNTRTSNSIRTSIIGGVTNIIKIILGIGYRTAFVYLLSEVYLGINGLFTNVLQILSLAELGVTTAITYRFYEPISRDDVHYVGMLMNFFGRIYRVIATTIFGLGILLLPFLKYLINSADQIPADINIYVIYLLFLLNTVVSYVFAYKLTLLTADQKNYIFSIIDLILNIAKYGIQILILYITHSYTLTLLSGITTTLFINFIASIWTEKQYPEVFEVKEMLSKDEQNKIFADTRACMYHKVGTTVLTGTDNVVLTKVVSLAVTGIYSNYSMVINYLQQFISQILGNFTASVGNAIQTMPAKDYYKLFKKINFVGLWVASAVSVGLYATIDDFIKVWLGEKYVLDQFTTIILCVQMFLTLSRITNGAFINAAGLFVKDKVRPLIEATLNLVISIILAYYMGIVGVFLGTSISMVLTVCWRDPYLLYKYSFKRSVLEYWYTYFTFMMITIVAGAINWGIKRAAVANNWGGIVLEGIVLEIIVNLLLFITFFRTDEFKYLVMLIRRTSGKIIRKNM